MIPAVGQIEIYPILRLDEITPFALENEPPRQQCLSANQLQTFSLSFRTICSLHFGLF